MAGSLNRPFDNFRVAITDPFYFWGRHPLLQAVKDTPFQVRILLGGRRIGKTSFLRAIEWTLLESDPSQVPAAMGSTAQSAAKPEKAEWVNKFFPTFSKLLGSQPEKAIATEPSQPIDDGVRAFPVFLNLQVEQPEDLESLRYLMISRLREAMDRWKRVPGTALREMYRQFLSQIASGEVTVGFLSAVDLSFNISNPDYEKRLTHDDFRTALLKTLDELRDWQFDGVCFLLDGADYVVDQDWANNAWSYLRGIKDTDTALKPFIGFVFSGYRNLRDYQQAVGSPLLNIAHIDWIPLLPPAAVRDLIVQRSEEEHINLAEAAIEDVLTWAGQHPYLTHQVLNLLLDDYHRGKSRSLEALKFKLLRHHDRDFSVWWDDQKRPYSFGEKERTVYRALMQSRTATVESLSEQLPLSYGDIADALETISGTGVISGNDGETYKMGSRLFEEWVMQQQINALP